MSQPPKIAGLVLAAGAGTRYGRAKALVLDDAGVPWLERAVDALLAGGCASVTVALGSDADTAAPLVPPGVEVLRVSDWNEGLSATLRAGLRHAAACRADALVVVPVDTPALPASAVRRVIEAAGPNASTSLVQAVYDAVPGHPVLIGASHLEDVAGELAGDRGARRALVARGVRDIECIDLWTGADIDAPA